MLDQHACPMVSITGPDGVGMVMMGSPTVLIDYMMACRLGDIVIEKPGLAMGPANPIIMGCPTVMIGDVGMGSPGPATMGNMAAAMSGAEAAAAGTLAQASVYGAGIVPVSSNALLSHAVGAGGDGVAGAGGAGDRSPANKKVWVEIALVDQNGLPVPNEPYSIQLPDGTVTEGSTDDGGLARVDGIDPGDCKISFPSLDQRSWKKK
jgi:type VI secretion system secreted protein VgrG